MSVREERSATVLSVSSGSEAAVPVSAPLSPGSSRPGWSCPSNGGPSFHLRSKRESASAYEVQESSRLETMARAKRSGRVARFSCVFLGQRAEKRRGRLPWWTGRKRDSWTMRDGQENRFPADRATNRQRPRSLTQILQTTKHSRTYPRFAFFFSFSLSVPLPLDLPFGKPRTFWCTRSKSLLGLFCLADGSLRRVCEAKVVSTESLWYRSFKNEKRNYLTDI